MTPTEILAIADAAATLLRIAEAQITAAQQRGEWTPEQTAAFRAKLATSKLASHWQPKGRR